MVQALPPGRPVRDDDREEILLPILGGLKELVFERPGLFIDRPGFIAGPPPDTTLGQAVQSISRLNCRLWAGSDKSGYSQVVNQSNAELCGPYLDSIDEKPEPGKIAPPFEGGQCATVYDVNINYTVVLGFCENVQTFDEVFALGVVGPLNVFTDNVGTPGGTSNLCPGFTYTAIRLVGPSGQVSQRGSGFGVRLNNLSVARADGLPDNCGNPPTLVYPPGTVVPTTPIPPEITVEVPGFGPVNVNVNLDPKGNPIVCVPELEVCVTVEIGGDDDDGGGTTPPGGGAPPPGDVGEPGLPSNTGEGGEQIGEAPPGSVLVGLKLDIVGRPPSPTRYTPEVERGVCYVYMGVPGLLDQDFGGSMVRSGQFLFAEKDNLTSWRVSANNGYNIRVTPYYRDVD